MAVANGDANSRVGSPGNTFPGLMHACRVAGVLGDQFETAVVSEPV